MQLRLENCGNECITHPSVMFLWIITYQTWTYVMICVVFGYIPLKEPRLEHIFINNWTNIHVNQRSSGEVNIHYWKLRSLLNSTWINYCVICAGLYINIYILYYIIFNL